MSSSRQVGAECSRGVGAQQAARNLDRLRRLQAASLDTQRIYTLDFTGAGVQWLSSYAAWGS